MTKRMYIQIKTDKGLHISIVSMIVITQTILLCIIYQNDKVLPCFLDVFCLSSAHMGYMLTPFAAVISIYALKYNFNTMHILKETNLRNIWKQVSIKLGLVAMEIAIVSVVVVGILGNLLSDYFFTWNVYESIYSWYTDSIIAYENVSYLYIIFAYVLQAFFISYTSMMITAFTYWLFKSYILGLGISTLYFATGYILGLPFATYSGPNYHTIGQEFSTKYQIIYPLAVLLVIYLLGYVLVKKRDFIGKAVHE